MWSKQHAAAIRPVDTPRRKVLRLSGVEGVAPSGKPRREHPRNLSEMPAQQGRIKNRGHRHFCRWPGRETPSSIGLLMSHVALKMAATSDLGAPLRRALILTRRPLEKTHSFSPVLLKGDTVAPIIIATFSASRRFMPWCTLGLFRPAPIAREVNNSKRKT